MCPFRAFNDVSGLSEAYSRVPMDTYERPLSGLSISPDYAILIFVPVQ